MANNTASAFRTMYTKMLDRIKRWLAQCLPIELFRTDDDSSHVEIGVSIGTPLFVECDPTSPIEIPILPRSRSSVAPVGLSTNYWGEGSPYRSLSYSRADEARRALHG